MGEKKYRHIGEILRLLQGSWCYKMENIARMQLQPE
jgi:hypothetical protein